MIATQRDIPVTRSSPPESACEHGVVHVIEQLPGGRVEGIAIPCSMTGRDLAIEPILENGSAEQEACLVTIQVGQRCVSLQLDLRSRCQRVYDDRTASRIAPVQRALRSAQYFDAVNVDEAELVREWLALIDTVHIDPDAFVGSHGQVEGANAADGYRRAAEAVVAANKQARSDTAQVRKAGDLAGIEIVPGKCRDGHRRALQTGVALCRGDDDLVQCLCPD